MFHVKTVYVSGVRYWETLHLCTNSCILAHCLLKRKYSLEILNYVFLSVHRIAHRTTFGPTQFINSFRIAKRH